LKPSVSVIIPTYKRGHLISCTLDGLRKQTYKPSEVIVVLKYSGDGTEEILRQYAQELPILIVEQKQGYVTDAYNIGLEAARGQILAFLDDDAIPDRNWLEEHVAVYERDESVGGVSGSSITVMISRDGKIVQIPENDFYSYSRRLKYFNFPWSRPLAGMSNWLFYFGIDGLVHHDTQLLRSGIKEIHYSLLRMGANMSVRKEAIRGVRASEELVLGFTSEQLLSYHIWRRGYVLLFNPYARVKHITQKESLGRFYRSHKRAALRDAEFALTFFSLKPKGEQFSWIAYFLSIIVLAFSRISRARENGLLTVVYRVYGLLYGVVTGLAHVLSRFFGQDFSIRASLSKLL